MRPEVGVPYSPLTTPSTLLRVAAEVRVGAERAPGFATAAHAVVRALRSGFRAEAVRCYVRRHDALSLAAATGADPGREPVDTTALLALLTDRPGPAELDVFAHGADADWLLDPAFLTGAGIASVVGIVAHELCVLLLTRDPVPVDGVRPLLPVAAAIRAGLAAHLAGHPFQHADYLAVLERATQDQAAELERLATTVDRLRAEAGLVDTLHAVGQRLTAQLDVERVVQDATDAATRATGAEFGAFFYNVDDQFGGSATGYTLSGVPKEAFDGVPMPRNTALFTPTFDGTSSVRSDDIAEDERFGHNPPYHGIPLGHLPVHSYLAVSAVSPTTREVLGAFFFGHSLPGRFTERHQYLAEGIAGYAAIALDNARMFDRERNLATELSRSMLPSVPEIPGLAIRTRYLPAATGGKVGGDWFDVIELPAGRTALVIGDVVGHGVVAAAGMGQVRTAIRSYALLDLAPGELLRNVSQLVATMPGPSFVTCFYAVHDPVGQTLGYANAGHLPAVLIHPGGTIEQIGEALGQPLGVGVEFPEGRCAFPPGTDLVLYTDGLVESHSRDLTVGIDALLDELPTLRAGPDVGAACDALIDRLTHGRHDDDIAFLHVHHGGERT